jgi:hypothetical protein
MTTREENIRTIKNWMEYFHFVELSDIDFETKATRVEDLTDDELQQVMEFAEEDRSRHITNGVFIRDDWTEAE